MRSSTRRAIGLAVAITGAAAAATATAAPAPEAGVPAVHAKAETPSLYDDEAGGNANADDPAIWYNAARPGASLVIGTAKEGGLDAYGLNGARIQRLPAPAAPTPDAKPGRFNNVDLLPAVRFPDGRKSDVAVVTDRGRDRIRFYRVDGSRPSAPLTDVTDAAVPRAFSATEAEVDEQYTAYGMATWRDPDSGKAYVLASRRNSTDLGLFEIAVTGAGKMTYRHVRTIQLPAAFDTPGGTWSPCEEPEEEPHAEGVVVDPERGVAYVSQEDVGLYKVDADLGDKPELIDKAKQFGVPGTYDPATEECVPGADPGYGGEHLTADVEGLTLFRGPDGERFLAVSSQGDNTYSVYDTADDDWAGSFQVTAGTVDGAEETDGIAALNKPLGSAFPDGLFATQDGNNEPASDRTDTDYKFVDLGDVMDAAGLD